MTNLHALRMPRFRPAVAAELAGHFLEWLGGRTDWLTILKLLYHVERRALELYGWPVIFDRMYKLPLGPVPDTVYKLLKGEVSHSEWTDCIQSQKPYAILHKAPVWRHLSRAQMEIAQDVFNSARGKSGFDLSNESHRIFPEWTDPGGSSSPIPYENLLTVIGKSDEEMSEIFSRLSEEAELEDMLG